MNAKISLRLEAARIAAGISGIYPNDVVETARRIERYVIGDDVLPDTCVGFGRVVRGYTGLGCDED